jgi:hypothetical protein
MSCDHATCNYAKISLEGTHTCFTTQFITVYLQQVLGEVLIHTVWNEMDQEIVCNVGNFQDFYDKRT